MANFLQRKIECSAKSKGLKLVSHIAEVAVKCCAPSTSMTSVADGAVKDALAECWRPAPCDWGFAAWVISWVQSLSLAVEDASYRDEQGYFLSQGII